MINNKTDKTIYYILDHENRHIYFVKSEKTIPLLDNSLCISRLNLSNKYDKIIFDIFQKRNYYILFNRYNNIHYDLHFQQIFDCEFMDYL